MEKNMRNLKMIYLGPAGSGLGFSLSGMEVRECRGAEELIKKLKLIKHTEPGSIVLVDEQLAANVLADVEALNEEILPAIVLLTSATEPAHLAAKKLNRLMVKAVGSDIF